MRQLSGSDAFFLYADKPGQHQHISMVYIYDPSGVPGGTVPFKTLLEHVRSRLRYSTIFRRRLARVPMSIDYPYWIEDPDFELEFHVRHIALPKPGDWRQLCIQLSRLHSRALNMTRPVWEMYVIEGLDNIDFLPEGCFAIMIKVHHVAIDDATEDDFNEALHEKAPDTKRRLKRDLWHPETEPGAGQVLTLAWFNTTTKLIETGQSIWDRLPLVGTRKVETRELLHTGEQSAPETRFDREITPYRVWNARFYDLGEIERIAAAVPGADVNDVVLTICGGAMRRYLEHHQEPPDSSLWSLLPVHVHQEADEDMPGHRVKLMRVRMMTTINDPLERLEAVAGETHHAKSINAISATELDELQDSLPSPTMALVARTIEAGFGPGKHYREDHNTIISSVPGPEEPLYLCGARLLAFSGMGSIVDNLALNHTVTTYDGKLTIAAVCDREIMPRPNFYGRCLDAAFEDLRVAVDGKK